MYEQANGSAGGKAAFHLGKGGSRGSRLPADDMALLALTVRNQVIPLLSGRPRTVRASIDDMVDDMIARCLGPDGRAASAHVAALLRRGEAPGLIVSHLLVPVARRLGVMWETDESSFAEVSIGMVRLQAAQRLVSEAFVAGKAAGPSARHVLLVPVPGEQHSYGLSIVLDHFHRAGWSGRVAMPATVGAVLALARRDRAHVVGLSIGGEHSVACAAETVAALRAAPAMQGLVILVGGAGVLARPDIVDEVGADGTADDAEGAVQLAQARVRAAAGYV